MNQWINDPCRTGLPLASFLFGPKAITGNHLAVRSGEGSMKKFLMLPVMAAALLAGGCEEDNDPTQVSTSANVRFVNAVTGLTGSTVFTANGAMAGTPLTFGQQTSQCTTINSGSAIPIAFGTANTAGTGINGTALTTANQSLTAGGNF